MLRKSFVLGILALVCTVVLYLGLYGCGMPTLEGQNSQKASTLLSTDVSETPIVTYDPSLSDLGGSITNVGQEAAVFRRAEEWLCFFLFFALLVLFADGSCQN